MRGCRFAATALAALSVSYGVCWAQGDEPLARKMSAAPAVDGDLSEWTSFPQIAMKQPNVPDLKVEKASLGWTADALHIAFKVVDGAVVNAEPLDRLTNADCLELRVCPSEKNRKTFFRLCVAPSSADGKPACTLAKRQVASDQTEILLATTEPSRLDGFRWAIKREEKAWSVEVTLPFSLLGVTPQEGTKLPFVMVVWDRDRPDKDEWGTGWKKRSESSSQKASVDQWPSLTLADANAQETLSLKSGVAIERHRPCNLFTPGQKVVLSFGLKGFPPGEGAAAGVLTDAYGKERGRVAVPIRVTKDAKASFEIDMGCLDRGYYELALSARLRTNDGRNVESAAKATLGVMEQTDWKAAEFLRQDRRFGLKWWGGVTDKQETVEMMSRLGLLWTRAIVNESLLIVTNSPLLSVVKIERFPKELFDEQRYGKLEDWEKQYGRGAWTLKTLPRKAEYQAWLAESLSRLPDNQRVFEIWNEPWDKMSPEDFATISQWIAGVVRKVRPQAILGPNLRGDMSAYGYDAKVADAGGMKGMDMVCLHPYGASEDRAFIRAYREWMSKRAGREVELYVTEYGTHSCPAGPAKKSEVEQARAVVRQSIALYAEDIKALIPHWVGQSENNPTYHEDWFGYIRKNQQPKPVLLAHANSARLIDGSRYLGDLWYGPGIGAMAFKKDGRNVLALWTREETREIDVATGVPNVVLVDLFGGEKPAATAGGRLKLTVGPDIVYVCGLADAAVQAATADLRADRWPVPEKPKRNERVAHRLSVAPVMDGELGEWNGASQVYIQNPKVNGDDASGIGYLAWDDGFLYLAIKMRDNELLNNKPRAKLYQHDSIEVFISSEPRDENTGYGPNDRQFFLAPTSGEGRPIVGIVADREAGRVEDVPGVRCHFGKTPNGWVAEVGLPWSVFSGFKPCAGAKLALELRVNDADSSHERWKLDPLDGNVSVENPTAWSILRLEP